MTCGCGWDFLQQLVLGGILTRIFVPASVILLSSGLFVHRFSGFFHSVPSMFRGVVGIASSIAFLTYPLEALGVLGPAPIGDDVALDVALGLVGCGDCSAFDRLEADGDGVGESSDDEDNEESSEYDRPITISRRLTQAAEGTRCKGFNQPKRWNCRTRRSRPNDVHGPCGKLRFSMTCDL